MTPDTISSTVADIENPLALTWENDRAATDPLPDKATLSFTAKLRGLHRDVWPADTERWLAEERATWETVIPCHDFHCPQFSSETDRPTPPVENAHPPGDSAGR